ncbi:Daple [Micromonospora sp. CPCC 206061]|uniref:Daple n=1 Tax=Micromonospora sp. CPCC 206061 TaxID=3122410 RepID=UPI002FEF0342
MDETGQPGGATPGENGNGAGPHGDSGGPARLNGWAAADATWSNAGAALEPSGEPVRPSWRTAGQHPGSDSAIGRGWADASPRYADLLSPLSPAAPTRPVTNGAPYDDRPTGESVPIALRVPASAPPYPYEGDLEDRTPPPIPAERPAPPAERDPAPALPPVAEAARHAIEEATPSGGLPQASHRERPAAEPPAPRWPERPEPPPSSGGPAAPGFTSMESPPAYEPPPGFRPQPERPMRPYDTSMYERPPSPGPSRSNTPWEWRPERSQEATEARRAAPPEPTLEPPPPPPAVPQAPTPPAAPAATQAPPRRTPEPAPDALPQRVPAEPDVPTVPEPPTVESSADAPDLTRIWSHLRRDDVQPRERPEGFDVQAIVAAVRGVEGVRDASVRMTASGAHNLRLDLADGADPAEVSRMVARLLQERMGLAAAPRDLPSAAAQQQPSPPPPAQPPSGSSFVPAQPQPTGRASVPSPGEPPRRRAARRAYQEENELAPPPPRVVAAPPAAVPPPPPEAPEPAEAEHPLGQSSTPVEAAAPRPLKPLANPGPRVTIDEVQVSTFGLDATVEVRLAADERRATGRANGPAVDAYVLRLCATAAAAAIDDLLSTAEQPTDRGRCFVEHTAVVPFGTCEVAIVVVLLVCGGWVEQLAGSALVAGDPRQAVVRATLGAVNRRLESLLS